MSASDNGSAPAYPTDEEGQCGPATYHYSGLTKREAMAMHICVGWIVTLGQRYNQPGYDDEAMGVEASRLAGYTADALLAALARTPGAEEGE